MRVLHIAVVIILTCSLTGCWGLLELQDVQIVAGVAVDKTEPPDEFEITTQIIQPQAVKENSPDAFLTRSATGVTIFEAVRTLVIKAGKKQLWEHVQTFIITSNIAKGSILPVLDFLYRDHEPRPSMYMFISREEAKKILKANSDVEPIPAYAIKKTLEEQVAVSKAPMVQFHEFIERLKEPFLDPYLPMITYTGHDYEISGTAIFKEDKLIGELSPLETQSMLRILGELKGGIQNISISSENQENPNYAALEIKQSSATIKVSFVEDVPEITIDIEEDAVIGNINRPFEINTKTIKDLERIYENSIEAESREVLDKIQKRMKANVFNFAHVINRKNKQYWKDHKDEWEEIYPTLEVKINVRTTIENNQLIKDSISIERG